MIDRLTTKRSVLLVVFAAASIILISGSRPWVWGSSDDAVLGVNALQGTGSAVAPGAMAAALVGLAAAVAAATSGPLVRVVAACSALLAAALGATVIIAVMLGPGGALGKLAAAGTGRSGTIAAHGQVGTWAWLALASMLVMGLGALGALIGGPRWHGLSSRYEAGEPPVEHTSDWDRLSRGEDPTADR